QEQVDYTLNSDVIIFEDNKVLKGWCDVYREALTNNEKMDYIMNKQPWTYDQIGLIIALSRNEIESTQLKKECNYKVPIYPYPTDISQVKIVHFCSPKILSINHAEIISRIWKQGRPQIEEIANELLRYG
ncbi:unnamed protein product, partial [marine sediment metagenome]